MPTIQTCSSCKNHGHNIRTCPYKKPASNQATAKMLYWSIEFHIIGLSGDTRPAWTGALLRDAWLSDIRGHPSDYDRGFYSLVATPAIEATIDWKWIAGRMPAYVDKASDGDYHLTNKYEEQLKADGYISE
jgi:hypothetical protein